MTLNLGGGGGGGGGGVDGPISICCWFFLLFFLLVFCILRFALYLLMITVEYYVYIHAYIIIYIGILGDDIRDTLKG